MQFLTNFYYKQKDDLEYSLKEAGFEYWEIKEEAFDKFNGTKLYICQPLPDDFSWEEALKNKVNIPETYYKKIEYSSIKDLIPYYPHITAFSCGSVICLSRESFVDSEEREILEWRLKDLLRIYNRCKRKKIEFDVEESLKDMFWSDWNKEPYRELANRVKEKGKKARATKPVDEVTEWSESDGDGASIADLLNVK